MLCKIERIIARRGPAVFRVSGDLRGANVYTLEELLLKLSNKVVLDLKEVTIADRHAVAVLAFCEQNGGELTNCPAYLREWVTNERANMQSQQT